jgi:ABC-type multidrug transport system ATPase subunit
VYKRQGLDYQAKRVLAEQLNELKHQGRTVLLASNDVEFVALLADQVVLMNNGQISKAGTAQQILPSLREHAPQLSQVTGSAIRISQVVTP